MRPKPRRCRADAALRGLALASAACFALAPAYAQAPSEEIIGAMSGPWLLAPENSGGGCRVTLGKAQTIGGYELALARECAGAVPGVADAAAWRFDPDGRLAFADATRKTIIAFVEQEDGTYVSAGGQGPRLVLTQGGDAATPAPNARDLFGTWHMKRPGGETICTVTFADAPPPGGEESYALGVATPCTDAVTRLKLVSWRIEGATVMLYGSDGATLAFESDGAGGFAKAKSEGGKPLVLVRK